jgi:hypothetical protein
MVSRPDTPQKEREMKELRSLRLKELMENYDKPKRIVQKTSNFYNLALQRQSHQQQNESEDIDFRSIMEGKRYQMKFSNYEKGEGFLEIFDEDGPGVPQETLPNPNHEL